MSEVRKTSSTGGQKGQKSQRMDLLPWNSIAKIAEVYGFGAKKYADHNWRKGYEWSLNFGAAVRHMASFWEGEDFDFCPEDCVEEEDAAVNASGNRSCKNHSGLPHLAHAAWHMLGLLENMDTHPEFDDRYATTLKRQLAELPTLADMDELNEPETEVVTIHQKNPDVDFDVTTAVQRSFDRRGPVTQ